MMTSAPTRNAPVRLSVMMFLQYAVWGVWLPYLANYLTGSVDEGGLGFSMAQMGWILGLAGSIGAVTAPFLAGQIADRFINAEIYLGLLLIVGGVLKWLTASATGYNHFLTLSILYSIVYMPTLALTNSIAFANLKNSERQFPQVRTFGTIGWIVASSAFPLIWMQTNIEFSPYPPFLVGTEKVNSIGFIDDALRVSGVLSVAYGLFAIIFMPRTPPTRNVERPFAFLSAFAMLKRPSFFVLTLVALPISMIHQVYFFQTGPFIEKGLNFKGSLIGPIMSIGQFAEIAVLAVLGIFLKRIGYRWVIILGAAAFAARFGLFAIATEETRFIVPGAMVLHGLCYGFFFAGAYLYIEKIATADIRHSVQTVFGIIILGVGPVLAGFYNAWLSGFAEIPGVDGADPTINYARVWNVQALIGLGSAIILAVAFFPRLKSDAPSDLSPGA